VADEQKPEAAPWDEPDWIADKSSPPKRPRGRQPWTVVAAAAGLLVVVVGIALWFMRERTQQARVAEDMAREAAEARAEAERLVAARHAEQEALAATVRQEEPLGPEEHKPERLGMTFEESLELLRLMTAADAKALNNLGLFHLELNEFDQAIAAFRKAAELDPRYAENLKLALKRQERFDRTAPPPREVVQP
jgi:tetratricopeptide (TPR) repeat protein